MDEKKAYQKILEIFKRTNKLKKVSYSVGNKRFCFVGYIKNGILKVELKNIYIDNGIHNQAIDEIKTS